MKATEVTQGFRNKPLAIFFWTITHYLIILIDYKTTLPAHTLAYQFWFDVSDKLANITLWLYRKKI